MKIVRFLDNEGQERLGRNPQDGTAELLAGDLFGELKPLGRRAGIGTLLAPISPPNIYGIGLNYREHVRQYGAEIPEHPVMFMKPTTSIANPGEAILIPKCCLNGPEVDYECELAVVIGRPARDVSVDEALDFVFGYTAANEVSARKGPAIVTAEEIPDPQNLRLSTTLNGTVMQEGTTADMIFSVAELVSFVSEDTTLLPGTVILTGTPPGAGFARTPPVFLKPGDEVHIDVEKIGRLSNSVSTEKVDATAAA
jgi:2-keto-4-pentenoate hydratase/2-oxohepta-3-ene-1,7-dioic acid hydratase in catechol pathway